MRYLFKIKWLWFSLFIIFITLLYVHHRAYTRLKEDQIDKTFEELRTKAELTKILLDMFPAESPSGIDLQQFAQTTKQKIGVRVTFIRNDGKVIADSDVPRDRVKYMDNHLHRPEVQQAFRQYLGKSYRHSKTVNNDLFYVALREDNRDFFNGFIRLSYYSQSVEQWISTTKTVFTFSFISSTLTVWFIVGLVLFLTSSNWRKVTEVAETVASGKTVRLHPSEFSGNSSIVMETLAKMLADIKREREYLQEALDSLEDAIIVVDNHGSVVIRNTQSEKYFTHPHTIKTDTNFADILHAEEVNEAFTKTVQSDEAQEIEFEHTRNGERRFYFCRIQPIYHYEKNRFLLFFRDITGIKRLQAIRRDFVANVSHEMKTPIASLIGYAETLLDHPEIDPEQKQHYLRRSLIQAKKMQALVADLLEISELEQGREIQLTSFPLKPLLEEAIANSYHKASQKKQTIRLSCPKEPIIVIGDQKRIQIVLDNLLQNAISYTQETGKIEISVLDEGTNKVKIGVKDNGVGIDAKFHDRIFQRFYRVDQSRNIHTTGTGLGLSIVKHIIEAHGQELGMESQPNEGSTFWFTLKREQ